MRKQIKTILITLTILLAIFVNIQLHINPVYAGSTPSIVASGFGSTEMIKGAYQWRSFYANGRYWVFYSDTTNFGYKTSTDASSWSSFTTINETTSGERFSLWYSEDLVRVYYVYARPYAPQGLFYGKGQPLADGTITWDQDEIQISGDVFAHPAIALNSTNYPWVTVFSSTDVDVIVFKAEDTEGSSWDAGTDVDDDEMAVNTQSWLLPLYGGKMYLLYAWCPGIPPDYIRGKLWNGTAWESAETPVTDGCMYGAWNDWSAISDNEQNIHLIYVNLTGQFLMYKQRDYDTGEWSSDEVLVNETIEWKGCLGLSVQYNTNDLYAFYAYGNQTYLKVKLSNVWQDEELPFGDTVWNGTVTFSTYNRAYVDKIGLMWVDDAGGSDRTIYFAWEEAIRTTTTGNFEIDSVPTEVDFNITEIGYLQTPFALTVPNATYHIQFPNSFETAGITWNFRYWSDNTTNTNATRTIDLLGDFATTVYYSSEYAPLNYTGYNSVFECAMNNMFELNGILEGNDTYRQMLLDTSIFENHGKMYPLTHPYAGPELTWGRVGKALEFDGVDDSVIIANSESLNITEGITIEFWFNCYNVTDKQVFISKPDEWVMGIENGTLFTELYTDSGTKYSNTTGLTDIEAGAFYYFSLTYDFRDGYYTVYLHGTPQYNVTTDGNKIQNVDSNIYLGNLANSSYWFNGVLDEIRIFPYKRNYDEIFSDARQPIRRFDSWAFVNSGVSDDGEDWTVIEGSSEDYQDFKGNDPQLPWAYANNSNPYTFVRTLQYVAGFQQYQLYCSVKFDCNETSSPTYLNRSYVIWYWSFFKNGRLQVTYDIVVKPYHWISNGDYDVHQWYIYFRRTTPYYSTEELVDTYVNTNTTLFPKSIPIIVSAWIGPDNKHFSCRIDFQDERVVTSSSIDFPFTYSFDLVDENLNIHIVDWFDGWMVSGIKVNAHRMSSGKWAKMEIESHKLAFLIPVIIIGAVIIGGMVAYYLFPQVRETVNTVVKEVTNVLQPIADMVGTAVRITGEVVSDALAGLSHDIIGGLSGLGAYLSEQLVHLGLSVGELAGSVWATLGSYAQPILSSITDALNIMGPALVNMIDGIFGWFGYAGAFSTFLDFLGGLWAWLGTSMTYLISLLTSSFDLMSSFMGKFLNATTTAVGIWANMINTFWNVIDGVYAGTLNIYTTIRIDLWIQLFFILYPIYLLYVWEERGLDAVIGHLKMMLDIGAFFGRTFITVIQLFSSIISRLIEMIPVAE